MTDVSPLVDHLFRTRSGQLVARLTRAFGPAHLALAEEVVQEALIKALQVWPFEGVPRNPGGWLLHVARNAALDVLRREKTFRDKADAIAAELASWPAAASPGADSAFEQELRDDELRMIFLCCQPSLSRDASVALSLKTVGGFSVAEIARAFLQDEAAIAQRLVRAKRQLRDERAAFAVPAGPDLVARLDSVLEVLYLMFGAGYNAHAGEDLVRRELCAEALRLGRLLAGHPATGVPKTHALMALLSFQAARLPARVDAGGDLVLLAEQDRSRWDAALTAAGFRHLARSAEGDEVSEYHLQAAIASVHARAATAASTDWPDILGLYDQLIRMHPSPIVALNRAVAVARVHGPSAGLAALEAASAAPELAGYYLLPAVRAQLWMEAGDRARAAAEFREALSRPCTAPERRFLSRKLTEAIRQ
jgi:RNA polymerase sigma-70 factor (ECF subfamily)